MKMLVTGGAGFIGTNFVLRTAENRPDWQPRAIVTKKVSPNVPLYHKILK